MVLNPTTTWYNATASQQPGTRRHEHDADDSMCLVSSTCGQWNTTPASQATRHQAEAQALNTQSRCCSHLRRILSR
jgi:hypothetical protein